MPGSEVSAEVRLELILIGWIAGPVREVVNTVEFGRHRSMSFHETSPVPLGE